MAASSKDLYTNAIDSDIEQVTDICEQTLRCTIYRLLEKIIEQESELGQLDFSSLPPNITTELRAMKEHIKDCERYDTATDLDKWIRHRIHSIIDYQLEFVLKHHHQTFYKLTADLDLTDEFSLAYDSFVGVCRKLMQNEITWFRIISLLSFGAEVAVFVIKKGGPGVEAFVNKIVHFVVEFIVKEEIAHWINSHGGWMTMINFFDSADCPNRGNHIMTLMTLHEATSFERWSQRILLFTFVAGVGFSIFKHFSSK